MTEPNFIYRLSLHERHHDVGASHLALVSCGKLGDLERRDYAQPPAWRQITQTDLDL